jgi:hypothetical protein
VKKDFINHLHLQKESNSKFAPRQFHKFKLSRNENVRKRLFEELKDYNDKLEKLLRYNDDDTRLLGVRSSQLQISNTDAVICTFWKNAKNVFQALASALTCQCQQHGAKLLLQHRTTEKVEFEISLMGFKPTQDEAHRVKMCVDATCDARKLTHVC